MAAEVAPQIRGLHDLAAVSISDELEQWVQGQIAAREHRRDLIKAVVANLDTTVLALQALEADGYPTLNPVVVPGAVMSELQSEVDDLKAAAAVFAPEQAASRLTVGLGAPAEKT
jgi:hypothetical protein